MRARLLLLKQDELCLLETQIDHIDKEETHELFLGNCRRDGNEMRKDVLLKFETTLSNYGMASSLTWH